MGTLVLVASTEGVSQGRQASSNPILLIIHGRNQSYQPSAALEERWQAALEDGLRKVGASDFVPRADRRFLYYGDVFEHQSLSSETCFSRSTGLPYARAEFSPIVTLARRYLQSGERNDLVSWIRRLGGRWAGSRALVTDQMPDVTQYRDDWFAQCEVDHRLSAVLDSARQLHRPVVIVAHSMGALVLFHTLLRQPLSRWPTVRRVVTIGSPLAANGISRWLAEAPTVADDYVGSPPDPSRSDSILSRVRRGEYVGAIQTWINAVGRDDHLAFPFGSDRTIRAMAKQSLDIFVETNEEDQHGYEGYLKNRWVASAIAAAWCDTAPTSQCKRVETKFEDVSHAPAGAELIRLVAGAHYGEAGSFDVTTSVVAGLGGVVALKSGLFPGYIEATLPVVSTSRVADPLRHGQLLARLPIVDGPIAPVSIVWGKLGFTENGEWRRSSYRGGAIGFSGMVSNRWYVSEHLSILKEQDYDRERLLLFGFNVGYSPKALTF